MNHPDPIKHKQLSFVKSAWRIAGFLVMIWSIEIAAFVLILAEAIGIYEETV